MQSMILKKNVILILFVRNEKRGNLVKICAIAIFKDNVTKTAAELFTSFLLLCLPLQP